MAETYWEQAARGAMPQNGGWTSLVNPLANTGQPIDLNALVPQQRSSIMGPAWDAANAAGTQQRNVRRELSNREKVVKQARDAQIAQQEAQKSRLDEAIVGYKARHTKATEAFAGAGKSATDEINRHYDALIGRTRQQMTQGGLGQTTIPATTISGIERDRAAALAAAGSQVATQATSADLQASGDYLNFLGNIQDEFDIDPLLDLSRAEGQATQDQLDPSAFGGNFFAGAMGQGAMIGGSAYGGMAGGGYGFGGGYFEQPQYQQPQQQVQGGWSDPFGVGVQQPQAVQQPMSPADRNRVVSYANSRAKSAKADAVRRRGSNLMQQKALARIAGGNHFQNASYGPDAALYAPR
jgi:hypothetical protein